MSGNLVKNTFLSLFQSLFVRVAAVLAVTMVAGLWFIAATFTPTATYLTEGGATRHVFTHPDFIGRMILAWAILVVPIYVSVRFILWLMRDQKFPPRP